MGVLLAAAPAMSVRWELPYQRFAFAQSSRVTPPGRLPSSRLRPAYSFICDTCALVNTIWTNFSECRTFWRESLRRRHGQSVPPTSEIFTGRPRNRSSRPLTIDPRQISINSIDLTDFILDSLYLPRFLAAVLTVALMLQ